jgi:hypothetical protein
MVFSPTIRVTRCVRKKEPNLYPNAFLVENNSSLLTPENYLKHNMLVKFTNIWPKATIAHEAKIRPIWSPCLQSHPLALPTTAGAGATRFSLRKATKMSLKCDKKYFVKSEKNVR